MSWCPFPGFRTVFVKLMIILTFTSEISEILRAAPLNVLDQRQQAAGVTDQFIQEGNNIWELGPMIPLLLPAVQHQLVQGDWAAHGRGQTVALLDGQDHLENRGRRWGVTAENKPIDFRSVQIWSLKSEINKIFWKLRIIFTTETRKTESVCVPEYWKVSTLKCDCTDWTVHWRCLTLTSSTRMSDGGPRGHMWSGQVWGHLSGAQWNWANQLMSNQIPTDGRRWTQHWL